VRALVQYGRFYVVQKGGVMGNALTWIKVAVLACVRDRCECGSYVEYVATLHCCMYRSLVSFKPESFCLSL
jgi:hypothetical protein